MKARIIRLSMDSIRKVRTNQTNFSTSIENPEKILVTTKSTEVLEGLKLINELKQKFHYTQISPSIQSKPEPYRGYLLNSEDLFIPSGKIEELRKQTQNKDEFIPWSEIKHNLACIEINNLEELKKILSFSNIKQIIKEYCNK